MRLASGLLSLPALVAYNATRLSTSWDLINNNHNKSANHKNWRWNWKDLEKIMTAMFTIIKFNLSGFDQALWRHDVNERQQVATWEKRHRSNIWRWNWRLWNAEVSWSRQEAEQLKNWRWNQVIFVYKGHFCEAELIPSSALERITSKGRDLITKSIAEEQKNWRWNRRLFDYRSKPLLRPSWILEGLLWGRQGAETDQKVKCQKKSKNCRWHR